jgi:hypothetical protein
MVCASTGLIKGKMFAIDGCRLPSAASKEWSGTKEELKEKYNQIRKQNRYLILRERTTILFVLL